MQTERETGFVFADGEGDGGNAGKVDWDGHDVFEIHSDRVANILANL